MKRRTEELSHLLFCACLGLLIVLALLLSWWMYEASNRCAARGGVLVRAAWLTGWVCVAPLPPRR